MAIYVEIRKVFENEDFVHYEYRGSVNSDCGKLQINKSTADVEVIKYEKNDPKGFYASRACMKLYEHWKRGEFPETTIWAS